MSSKPRIIAPNLIYQITSQGPLDINLFDSVTLKTFFLDLLSEKVKKYCCSCLAFSLTKNQYHLVIKSGDQSISDFMQCFNSILAKKVNKTYRRDGTVFRKRFKSVIVEDGDLIKDLIRLVHLEPLNKGDCTIDNLDCYNWSSHSVLLGNSSCDFLNSEEVLKHFKGSDQKKEYSDYIHNGIDNYQNEKVVRNIQDANLGKMDFRKADLWIIGTPDFVQDTFNKDKCRRTRIARYCTENVTFQIMHQTITALLDLDDDMLLKQGKLNVKSTARELFVYMGKYRYDYSGAQLAGYLKVTESAISRMIKRFQNIDNKDYLLKEVVGKIV